MLQPPSKFVVVVQCAGAAGQCRHCDWSSAAGLASDWLRVWRLDCASRL